MTTVRDSGPSADQVEVVSNRRGLPTWMPMAVFGLLMVMVVRQSARPLSDPDSFWHLRLGEQIWSARSVGTPDWSTADDRSWVLTQWLPEVVAARFEAWLGLPGVAWLFGASLLVLVVAVYFMCRQRAGLLASAFATGLAVVAMGAGLSPRPHMVTYVLLATTLAAWLRTVDDLRPRWWLLPLSWLWACCHGMWFTGPLVGLLVILGLRLDQRVSDRDLVRLAVIPLGSVFLAALTPVGPKLLGAPFAVGGISAYITEWQPPSFRTIGPAAAMLILALVVLTWSRTQRRVPWTNLLLLLMATGWTLLAVRTVTLGAIIAAPLLAGAIQTWLHRRAEPRASWEKPFVLGAAAVCLVGLALVVSQVSEEPARVPSGLDPQLSAMAAGTPVLNDYATGGWLRWAHPGLDPLIDGLTEAYSLDELRDYGTAMAVGAGWEDIVGSSRAEYALLKESSPLASALEDRLSWVVLGADEGFVLLSAPDASSGA
ncbi:hypothetical protein ncot_15325 [Nocardioides sp. JQ2195]|uniref:hypothetical protein n=1 Tax=Nocardioides sp. JQ2195 TaxID=2592334 RepID=UPI00143E7FDA|nr:hypothetical protein [Nocardioides sp. JQ2195]QIX27810.1 hypothetical protein ncot_15325 [Nocardioides sp. JQ2195]